MTEILLCLYKQFISYDRAKTEKLAIFCAHMVDFRRPGHIYHIMYSTTIVLSVQITQLYGNPHIHTHRGVCISGTIAVSNGINV